MKSSSTLVEPTYLSLPEWHDTVGPEVGELSVLAGFPPDPEQQLGLDAGFAVDKRGKSVAFEIAVIAPRQNLKTGLLKQAALGYLFVTDESLVVWSAHEFTTAQEAAHDLEALIENCDMLRKRVDRIYHGTHPEIRLLSGARLIFRTRTAGGGRGLSGRKVFLDEGYALQPSHIGALMPTMAAQPDPQLWYASSACRPESDVLRAVIARGRSGDDPRLAHIEYCARPPSEICREGDQCPHTVGFPGCGCDVIDNARSANPQMGRRILVETVEKFRRSMPPLEYVREIMGWHDAAHDDTGPAVPGWDECEDVDAVLESIAAFGIDCSPDRSQVAIAAVGPTMDGRVHVELIEERDGLAGMVERCIELNDAHGPAPFVIDVSSPASNLLAELDRAGLEVVTLNVRELARACGTLVDAAANKTLTHGPDEVLARAVSTARRVDVGDGLFRFGRRASVSNIAPLIAVTVAAHVLPQVLPLDDVSAIFA